jgi:WD40 repeat protein
MKARSFAIGWLWASLWPCAVAPAIAQVNAPQARARELWAIIVGVGDYRDSEIPDIPAAADQAAGVLNWFRTAGWDENHQLLLRDFGSSDPGRPEAPARNILPTRANLDWAVRQWLLPRARQGDLVIFYYAGRAAAVMDHRDTQVEPRVEYYLLPTDAFQANAAMTGWSLDRAVDDCARRRIRVVCWLATNIPGRSTPGAVPVSIPPPIGRPSDAANPTGRDWLRRLARWPGVTAWLAADGTPGIGEAADPITPFTTALLGSLGKPEDEDNLAASLKRLQRDSRLKRLGFSTLGGVPPDLNLWADRFGKPVKQAPPEMVLQVGHADKVTGLVSAGDGRLLISSSMDSTLRIWSPPRRALLRVLAGQMVGVTAMALSHDDRWLISGGGRGLVLVHDLENFAVNPAPKQPHNKGVAQVALLPDASHFVTVDRDGTAALWDLNASPLEPRPWPEQGPGQGTRCLEVAAGGNSNLGMVAARFGDETVRTFDAHGAGGTEASLPQGRVSALAVGNDGHTLAAGYEDGRVVILDRKASRQVGRSASPGPVRGLMFSQIGWLVVGHKRGVQLMRTPAQAGAPMAAIELLDRPPGTLSVSPDGRYLAACTENIGEVRAWRLDEVKPPQAVVEDAMARASMVAFSGDGRSLVIGGFDGSVAVRPVEQGRRPGDPLWAVDASRGKVQRIAATRSRRSLLLIDELDRVLVWDLKDRTCRRLPGAWSSGVFLTDDELVLTAPVGAPRNPGHLARMRWDGVRVTIEPEFFSRLNEDFRVPERPGFESLVASPDGSRVAATSSPSLEPLVCVWDAKTGKVTHWIKQVQDPVRSLSFSSDGRHLLTAGDSPEARLWDLAAKQGGLESPVAVFVDPDGRNITCATIRPGHGHVVAGNSDGQVHLWNWKDGKVELEMQQLIAGVFAGAVKALTFTPDGKTLAAAGDGTSLWLATMEPRPGPISDLEAIRPHHDEQINSLIAWPDQSILISGSDDTTVKFWDLKERKLWGTFSAAQAPDVPADDAPARERDWVFYTPDGLFDATPEGAKLVCFRDRHQAHRLEQYEALNFAFRLSDSLLTGKPPRSVPQVEETPPVSIIPPVRSDPSLPYTELTVSLGETDLKDVRLYHNERPIPTGLDPRQPLPPQFPVRVRLLKGTNRFYALASREGTFDSRSDEVEIPYDGPVEPGRLHVVALGVGDYERRRLGYAVRDADRLSEVLHTRGLDPAGKPGLRIVLPDTRVNQENVEKAFDEVARRVEDRPQDTVVVFLAGHTGVFDPQRFCLLLPSFPFPPEEPVQVAARDVVPERGRVEPINPGHVLPYSVIAISLMRLKALNRLVIVDACQAEAILEDPQVAEIQKWMEIGSRRARTSYLMAARRGEPALEVDPLHHGLFTYTLLRGMGAIDPQSDPEEVSKLNLRTNADFDGNGILSTSELDTYVKQYLPGIAGLYPELVTRRQAQLPVRRQAPPLSKLEQRARLQAVDVSFPLVPVRQPRGR